MKKIALIIAVGLAAAGCMSKEEKREANERYANRLAVDIEAARFGCGMGLPSECQKAIDKERELSNFHRYVTRD